MIQHEQTGILVEYGEEERLAEELVQLLRDAEKLEQLGQAPRKWSERSTRGIPLRIRRWNVIRA